MYTRHAEVMVKVYDQHGRDVKLQSADVALVDCRR